LRHNPAGVASVSRLELELGWHRVHDALECGGDDAGGGCGAPSEGHVGWLGVGGQLPAQGLLRDRVHLALVVSGASSGVLDVTVPSPGQPSYLERTSRPPSSLLAGVAAHLGAGVRMGASARWQLGWADQHALGPGAAGPHVATGRSWLPASVALRAGTLWDAHPRVRVGLAYSGGLSLPLSVRHEVDVAGGTQGTEHRANVPISPPRLDFGAQLRPLSWLDLLVDVGWARWSATPAPGLRVKADVPARGASPAGSATLAPAGSLRDAAELRVAGRAETTWRGWLLRPGVGVGWIGAPAEAGANGAPWLDAARGVCGLGLQAHSPGPPGDGVFVVGVGAQVSQMGRRERQLPGGDEDVPAGDIAGGGRIWDLAVSVGWRR